MTQNLSAGPERTAYGAAASGGPAYSTIEEAVEIARALGPKLRGRVPQAEEMRRLPSENVDELLASGLIALENPKRFGGPELSLDALIAVTGEIAEACSSTGWVYCLWASHMWLIGQFPEHVQAEVFGNRRSLVSSVVNTVGTPVAVPGGFRWTGRGFFSSGVDHCNWLIAAMDASPGQTPPDRRWFLIPRSDIEIIDDWFTFGLKGTGSKTVVLEDVFIPDDHVLAAKDLSEGNAPGARLHDSTLYHAAMDFTFSLPIGAPVIGIARAVRRAFEERVRARLASPVSRLVAEQETHLTRLAEASAQIDAAHDLMTATARRFCTIPATAATAVDRAQCRRNVAFAAQLCRQACNSLFEASGASNVFESGELQRLWRDSNAAAHHHGATWDVAGYAYGRALFGLPPMEQAAR